MGSCQSNPASKYAVDDDEDLAKHAQKGTKAKRYKVNRTPNSRKASGAQRLPPSSTGFPPPSSQLAKQTLPLQQVPSIPSQQMAQAPNAVGSKSTAPPALAPKPRLNIKDYQFKQCKGEVKVKAPGAINGQAFMIDECEDCDLYVLDSCAAVTIDDSKNCRIFIGPTDGSIFMRNCSNVKCCFLGRQIRLRDVTNSSIALLCRTKPIIETSTNVAIMCYDLCYPALPDQLKSVKLDPFHNFWDSIHDYTPKSESWRYLQPELAVTEMMGPFPEEVQAAMGEAQQGEAPLISTWGSRPPPGPGYLMALFSRDKVDEAFQLVAYAKEQQVHVLFTNKADINSQLATQVAKAAGWPLSTAQSLQGVCYGLELSGERSVEQSVRAKAEALGAHCTTNRDAGELFRHLGIEG